MRQMDAQVKGGLSLLDRVRQENATLKDELSELVQLTTSKHDIEYAEYIQQRFIEIDQIVDLLRHDLMNLLIRGLHRQQQSSHFLVNARFIALKRSVFDVKDEFELLKETFEKFIKHIQQTGIM